MSMTLAEESLGGLLAAGGAIVPCAWKSIEDSCSCKRADSRFSASLACMFSGVCGTTGAFGVTGGAALISDTRELALTLLLPETGAVGAAGAFGNAAMGGAIGLTGTGGFGKLLAAGA